MNNRKEMNGYQMLAIVFLLVTIAATGFLKDGPVTEADLGPMGPVQMTILAVSAGLSLIFWIVSLPEVRVWLRRANRPSEPDNRPVVVLKLVSSFEPRKWSEEEQQGRFMN